MQIPFDITGVPDSGAAINVATAQAHASGFTHVSVVAVQQLDRSPARWRVVLFCANSAPVSRRSPAGPSRTR